LMPLVDGHGDRREDECGCGGERVEQPMPL
jgi:hypothetical protein